jgi:2-hydroxychromene-2-carboxylate isomerase
MLTLYIDFKSAGAYLALKPTLALAKKHDLAIDWRPFKTIERDVPKLGQEETVGESHRRVRAASQRALAIKYAAHQGIDLRYPSPLGDTDLALGILAGLDGDKLPFVEAAFDAYWSDHANLDDEATVRDLIAKTGSTVSADLASARGALAAAQDAAEEAGIVGAPAYVIADQIFVGREHLPWIEELVLAAA